MNSTEIIALHLPQFHQIPENDEWWGEGFTEWTNVKKAKPIYDGHLQPRIPLNGNYYDLSDVGTVVKQMELAAKYGVDGFCFYHYWFKGKKLLYKPIEALLELDRIPLRFMLSWANEPWTRTWDGSKGAETILMAQDYGKKNDWIEHYNYLARFFERKEYIKIYNRPVIVVYNSADIDIREEMFTVWNEQARQDGFADGLYIINTHRLSVERELPMYGDAVFDFEPMATYTDRLTLSARDRIAAKHAGSKAENHDHIYEVFDFGRFCELMTSREAFVSTNHYLGFFTGWDNTPRRGIDTSLLFDGNSPDVVERFFEIQYKRSIDAGNKFLFINAWNEWGEGAILEADEVYGYGYLEGIKRVKDKYGRSCKM